MITRLERQGKICKEQTCQVWNIGKSVNYFCGKLKNASNPYSEIKKCIYYGQTLIKYQKAQKDIQQIKFD